MWICGNCGVQNGDDSLDCEKCGFSRNSSFAPFRREKIAGKVNFRIFSGTLRTWDSLFSEAAEFSTQLGRERLISMSHSEDAHKGVVTVWYWDEQKATEKPEGL